MKKMIVGFVAFVGLSVAASAVTESSIDGVVAVKNTNCDGGYVLKSTRDDVEQVATYDSCESNGIVMVSTKTGFGANDFVELSGFPRAVKKMTEVEVASIIGFPITSMPTLITDSSKFYLDGVDVTGGTNGIIQLTAADIEEFGLSYDDYSIGDYFIYDLDIDSLPKGSVKTITFEVLENDFDESTEPEPKLVTITVNGEDSK